MQGFHWRWCCGGWLSMGWSLWSAGWLRSSFSLLSRNHKNWRYTGANILHQAGPWDIHQVRMLMSFCPAYLQDVLEKFEFFPVKCRVRRAAEMYGKVVERRQPGKHRDGRPLKAKVAAAHTKRLWPYASTQYTNESSTFRVINQSACVGKWETQEGAYKLCLFTQKFRLETQGLVHGRSAFFRLNRRQVDSICLIRLISIDSNCREILKRFFHFRMFLSSCPAIFCLLFKSCLMNDR